MKRNSMTFLLAAAGMLLAGVQTAKAQKVVLHMAGNQTFECSISKLDSITFVGGDLIIEEEHEWVDLGLPSGTLWATCNVGANSPEKYGDYFAWGEIKPKDDYGWGTYIYCAEDDYYSLTKYCTHYRYGFNLFTDDLTELLPEDDAATANWSSDWQMPSHEQITELCDEWNTTATWTTQNGIEGQLIKSNRNGNTIFLPAAGHIDYQEADNTGSYGCYWSRSLCTKNSFPGHAYLMYVISSGILDGNQDRSYGRTVRPVRVKTR
ncbi:MAG: hypothetical protein IK144_12905 [Bacteroidaceae bacterium]|nr:hypothetical protein [Bacteroidaceae bacterium]